MSDSFSQKIFKQIGESGSAVRIMRDMPEDIFISYAHRDDNGPPGRPGIVTRLESLLRWAASQKVGRDLTIARDDKMASGQFWENTLIEQARNSRVFVPIISPSWIVSDDSQKEWTAFWEARFNGQPVGRVPVIPITFELDDPWAKLPAQIRQIQVKHHLKNGMSDADLEAVTLAVAIEIADLLSDPLQSSSPVRPLDPSKRVFLGLAFSAAMKDWKKTVANELTSKGFAPVEVSAQAGIEAAEFSHAVKDVIQNCVAAVHFLDERSGGHLEGDRNRTVIQLQCEAANRQGLRNYLWTGPELDFSKISDETYRAFLRSASYTNQPVTEFKSRLVADLVTPLRPDTSSTSSATREPTLRVVCLVCESGDDVVDEIKAFFSKKQIAVTVPDRQVAQKLISKAYEDAFRDNEHFLFYWGNGTKEWCDINYENLVSARLESGGKMRNPRAIALYCAAQRSEPKEKYEWPWPVLRRYDRFDGAALDDFITHIGGQ